MTKKLEGKTVVNTGGTEGIGLGRAGRSEKELHDFMLAFYDRWLPVLDLPVPAIAVLQGDCIEEALKTARAIGVSAPSVVRLLKKNLGINKTDLTSELEMNAEQHARDFQTDEYRNRVANYLPDHYA